MHLIENNPVLEVILNRRSVRNFVEGSIRKELFEMLLRAGMAAPSAMNLQPWNFICITKKEILNDLADGLPYAKMLYNSLAAIVVCGTPDTENLELSDYWVQDCSAATENILLAIESAGLGAVWTGVYPRKTRMDHVRKVLHIPEGINPLNVIVIGIPIAGIKPKDKYDPGKIHWECW